MTFLAPNDPQFPEDDLACEIAELERRLAAAKEKRVALSSLSPAKAKAKAKAPKPHYPSPLLSSPLSLPSSTHFLLLLSDSALPLGAFAFSSGLESYLAHHKARLHPLSSPSSSFSSFLPLSISSFASTTLPFCLSAHRDPSTSNLLSLDDALDASIICTVGRRASVAQGRALLSIWERSLVSGAAVEAQQGLKAFGEVLKRSTTTPPGEDEPPAVAAHLAPLFGAIGRLVGLSLEQTAYVFVLGHVKALVSAAVRAGMFGPYQAQKTLAGEGVQGMINAVVRREWETEVESAGQCVPVMDLWFGRHEVLYSRIFNS